MKYDSLGRRVVPRRYFGRKPGLRRRGYSRPGAGTLKASITPTIRDLEWAAGFLEGEGCFTKANRSSQTAWAKQVNDEPVLRLLDMFGGSLTQHDYPSNEKWKDAQPIWRWAVYGCRARGVMMTLYKLMSTRRREQIRHALADAQARGS